MIHEDAVDALVERAHREIDEGILPSCQLAIGYEGEIVREVTLGDAPAGDCHPLHDLLGHEGGRGVGGVAAPGRGQAIALDDRVADHIPEFGDQRQGRRHRRAGVAAHVRLSARARSDRRSGTPAHGRLAAFSKWRLNWEPGTQHEYHATTAHWVLAELLARTDGCEHTESVRRRVLDPLGLKKLALGVPLKHNRKTSRASSTPGEPADADEFQAVIGVSVHRCRRGDRRCARVVQPT